MWWRMCFGAGNLYESSSNHDELAEFINIEYRACNEARRLSDDEFDRLYDCQKSARTYTEKKLLRIHMAAEYVTDTVLEAWIHALDGCLSEANNNTTHTKTQSQPRGDEPEESTVSVDLKCENCATLWNALVFRHRVSVKKDTKKHYLDALANIDAVFSEIALAYDTAAKNTPHTLTAEEFYASDDASWTTKEYRDNLTYSVYVRDAKEYREYLTVLRALKTETCWEGGKCTNAFTMDSFYKI